MIVTVTAGRCTTHLVRASCLFFSQASFGLSDPNKLSRIVCGRRCGIHDLAVRVDAEIHDSDPCVMIDSLSNVDASSERRVSAEIDVLPETQALSSEIEILSKADTLSSIELLSSTDLLANWDDRSMLERGPVGGA